MIDMEKYYGRREAAARENGSDELACMYQRLKVVEGLARSGQLSESMSRVLSANTAALGEQRSSTSGRGSTMPSSGRSSRGHHR